MSDVYLRIGDHNDVFGEQSAANENHFSVLQLKLFEAVHWITFLLVGG